MAIDNPNLKGFYELIQVSSLISLIPDNILERCQEVSSSRASVAATLSQVRKQVAEFWLGMPEEQLENTYSSDVGKIHKMVLSSGIRGEPLTDIEQNFVHKLVAGTSSGFDDPKAIHYLLAAMLYRPAHQLPLRYEFTSIPQWFLNDYLQFMCSSPDHFHEAGEVDDYYHHIQRLTDYLHTSLFNNLNSEFWHRIASFFTQNLNCTYLLCSTENLKNIFSKRADIAEFLLKTNGFQIDYTFPKRPANRKKIRLGILINDFNPYAEVYNALPVFEYLDRNKFEIFLYAVNVNGHPLEQYCRSRADQLVQLPEDLGSQVKDIRADHLDILLICSGVSDAIEEVGLLALHRLAPIQATNFTSPATTGMRNVDYYISSNMMEPVHGAQEHYREQLITLDGAGFCFTFATEPDAPTVKPNRRNIGVVDESIVFVSGASPFKLIPELRETWAKIIAAVPNAVLVLYPSHSDQYLHSKISASFAKYGIEKDRLIILKIKGRSNVKECLKLCDVYLHTYPYSGVVGTLEALEAGLPIVAMDGNTLRSRSGEALLRDLQMPDLIANHEESYVQLAIALGTNPELRQQKSNEIKEKMQHKPKFIDSRYYSTQMSALFQELFEQHLKD